MLAQEIILILVPQKLSKTRIINNVAPVDTLRSFQEALPNAKLVSA